MKWEFLVSLRYLLAKRKEKFASVTTVLSVASVTVGVAALIIVLAVMNGFGDKLRQKIVGFNYHLQIYMPGGIEDTGFVLNNVRRFGEVVSASPFIDGQAIILARDREPKGVLMRGIDPSVERKSIDINIKSGSIDIADGEIAVGNELAKSLNVAVGDGVRLISGSSAEPAGYRVAAVFHSGMYDFDANAAFTSINSAKKLFATSNKVHGIGVRLKNLDSAGRIKASLIPVLGRPYVIRTWSELNKNLFAAIRLEKILVFIVVALTIAVGALNIINTLSLLTMEKTKDIGILKALGATSRSIASIYVFKGLTIGAIGSFFGFILGFFITKNINVLAGLISRLTGFELFSRDIYYLDKIPAVINYADIGLIITCAVALSFLAALYPARRASRLDPVEALRYE